MPDRSDTYVIHRPSGDTPAEASLNSVAIRGVTRRSSSIDSMLMSESPDDSPSTKTSDAPLPDHALGNTRTPEAPEAPVGRLQQLRLVGTVPAAAVDALLTHVQREADQTLPVLRPERRGGGWWSVGWRFSRDVIRPELVRIEPTTAAGQAHRHPVAPGTVGDPEEDSGGPQRTGSGTPSRGSQTGRDGPAIPVCGRSVKVPYE